jgi:hypothetical protein
MNKMEVLNGVKMKKKIEGHVHNPTVGLDNIIKCQTCGDILPYAEKEICKVSSANRVQRVLEEIAVAGGYVASSFENGFIVYTNTIAGIREEVTASKISGRNYRVYKRMSKKGGTGSTCSNSTSPDLSSQVKFKL